MKNNHKIFWCVLILFLTAALLLTAAAPRQADNPNPPDHVVKLIFIHHSTGENWLRDDYGGLGQALADNNYFVSDTNYSWGPDSIGDRTDIPNWTEWFTSDQTPTYMDALFNESGQNSEYTRLPNDPGGENQIVMFKSCFPNSDLGGNPDDPPGTYEDMTVSGAKYVYNQILQYFASRQDKLFVVITAPPLRKADTSTENATNARAFNDWLVNDWLRENDYPYNNVAIFDFYNVLTGPDNHHRFVNGQIEHIYKPGTNTSHYPTEDSHPSAKGSQKATEEFIPLLNIFYHRWQDGSAQLPLVTAPPPTGGEQQPPISPPPARTLNLIDDFEGGTPPGTAGWETYFQDGADTQLTCATDSSLARDGAASLKFKFDVAANSWATCGIYFDPVQGWQGRQGISFYLRADQAGLPFDINLHGGTPAGRTTYVYHAETPPGSVDGWVLVEIGWEKILRAEWEENPGTSFDPSGVTGFSFGLSAPEQSRLIGTIWADDLQLMVAGAAEAETPGAESLETETPESKDGGGSGLPCLGGVLLPLVFVGLAWMLRRR